MRMQKKPMQSYLKNITLKRKLLFLNMSGKEN
ncbi:hypothetical protein [Escherichia phage BI-EHEC]|nr:hypothetical protein [Escherichia phage BI-EHEC]